MRIALLSVLALLLAGCGSDGSAVKEAAEGPSGSSGDDAVRDHQLSGWIFDAALQPIVGALVEMPGENVTAVTASDGYYGFAGLDVERVMVVQATADGFTPATKTITLVDGAMHRMNFTLARVPVKEAYMEKQAFTAHIGCSVVAVTSNNRQPYDCGIVSTVDNRVWDFNVAGDVAGIVVEANWESDTPLATHLNLTLETVDLGIFDERLAYVEGESILQAVVTKEQSERFFRQGGTVRATVDIGRNIADEEAGVGAGVAIEQEVELIASIFYVTGPPPGYTSN